MFPQELLAHPDIFVRKRLRIYDGRLFALPRFSQVLAIEWTMDGLFPLVTATDGADVASHGGTIAARLPNFTESAECRFDTFIVSSGIDATSGFCTKVELELDEKDTAERIAGEICRQLKKNYGVRHAEVSNVVEKD